MENMTSLLKMHYTSILALKKSALVMLGVIIFITISNKDGSMLPFSGAILIMLLNYTTLAYEDKSKMNYLIYSLPIKPKQYILSKYIYGIINTILSIWFADIMYIILNVLKMTTGDAMPVGVINITLGIVGVIIVSIVVPIALVVGFNKARLILVFLAVIPACFSKGLANIVYKLPDTVNNLSFINIVAITLAVGVMITAISYVICSNLYAKRDIC